MHLGNGAITPECGLVAMGIAATSAGIAVLAVRNRPLDRNTALTAGALGAAVFAAQMFNVQVWPYSSVHLIGGVLLAWTLGSSLGLLLMAGILTIQALALGDGGLIALGANIINMGLMPALLVAAARRFRPADSNKLSDAATIGATALLATTMGAGMVVLEVTVGRSAAQLQGWGSFAAAMLGCHALFGVLEAIVTVSLVAVLGGLARPQGAALRMPSKWAATLGALSVVVALMSLPALGLASTAPDGYESAVAAARQAGQPLGRLESADAAGNVNARIEAWQKDVVSRFPGPLAARVAVTTLIAGVMAWGVARSCSKGNGQIPVT
jgi:cobalt/nickel transport system permease protein